LRASGDELQGLIVDGDIQFLTERPEPPQDLAEGNRLELYEE